MLTMILNSRRKYIDSKLKTTESTKDATTSAPFAKRSKPGGAESNPDDVILFKAAERIKGYTSNSSRQDELLSNQMLVGIPEVDLGIE